MKIAVITYWDNIDELIKLLEAEQFDKLFATEQTALALLQRGLSLSGVVSDFDSIDIKQFAAFNVPIVQLPTEKDNTDGLALYYHVEDHYPDSKISVYNNFDVRIDHALSLLSILHQNHRVTLYTPDSKIVMLFAGQHAVVPDKNYQYISFVAIARCHDVHIQHLKYETNLIRINPFSDVTVSNEFVGNSNGKITIGKGQMLMIYSRDKNWLQK